MKKSYYLLLVLGLFTFKSTLSTFYNSGSMYGYDLSISTDCYENTGTMKAYNEVNISAITLQGSGSITGDYANIQCDNYNLNGLLSATKKCIIKTKKLEAGGTIEGKNISIICDEFKFNGAINADECIIYTKNPFDYTMFTKNTHGKYAVIITKKNNIQLFTDDSLRSRVVSTFIDNCLCLAEENIENEVQKIRNWGVLNRIDETKIFDELKKEMEAKIDYYKERLNEKRGPSSDLFASILTGAAGASIATITFLNRKCIMQKLDLTSLQLEVLTAIISGFPLLFSAAFLTNWLSPQYKERYEKLSLILSKIDQSLMAPRIPEEEIIVLQ